MIKRQFNRLVNKWKASSLGQEMQMSKRQLNEWRNIPGSGYFKMMNFNSLKPMEVSGNSTSAGAKITQWDDLLANNQQWSLVLVP